MGQISSLMPGWGSWGSSMVVLICEWESCRKKRTAGDQQKAGKRMI